jgi:hypothetical protein
MIAMDISDQDQVGGGKSIIAALGGIDVDHLASGLEHEAGVLDRRHGEGSGGGFELFGFASSGSRGCQREGAEESGEFHADIVCPREGLVLEVPELSNPGQRAANGPFVPYTF